ncbi:MAG: AAA family ATPase [Alphaproteobacteria bacterium]|nr:AAA family ATPase [Alphaproteobacteria bacterium]MBL7096910.1 AAA family ATPase [Alphaproteobacteria bacterium]
MQRDNFHIFTGGPGAGKTTLLEAMRAQGYACVEEAARRVLRQQAETGGNATHDGDRSKYRDLMLELGVRDYHAVTETVAPVFFDRGIPELSGYGNAPGEPDPPALTAAIAECRYNPCVFLFPAWQDIYVHDDLRKHTFEHAVMVTQLSREVYGSHGYTIIEVPRASVEERVRFVLHHLTP